MNPRYVPLLLTLAATGCDKSTHESEPSQSSEKSILTHLYTCESNRTIQVSYPTEDTATLEYEGQALKMSIAVSGSGSRYVGGGLEWWSKGSGPGSEGTLFRHEGSDNSTGESVELCKETAGK